MWSEVLSLVASVLIVILIAKYYLDLDKESRKTFK